VPPDDPFRKPGEDLIYIRVRWSGPEGVIDPQKEFIVDPGAERSLIEPTNTRGKGLRFVGYEAGVGVGGETNSPAWDAGTMRFKTLLPDGTVQFIECSTVVTEGAFNLLGQDQLKPNRCAVFCGDPPALLSGFVPPQEK
jgi:hypothetical protein